MIRKLALATIPVFIKTQPTGSLQVSSSAPCKDVHILCCVVVHQRPDLSRRKPAGSSTPAELHLTPGHVQAVLGEVVLVAFLFAVTYWRPYMARIDNLLAMGSLFGAPCLLLEAASALSPCQVDQVRCRACTPTITRTSSLELSLCCAAALLVLTAGCHGQCCGWCC